MMNPLLTKYACTLLNVLIFVFCCTTIHAQDAKTRLYDLYDEVEEYEDSLRSAGEETAFSTFSIAEREEQDQYWKEKLERLSEIDRGALEWGDRVSYDLFERDLLREIQDHEFADYLVPINHEGGFHTRIVGRANSADPESVEEYEKYIARLKSVPKYFEGNMELMRKGLATGQTLPQKVLTDDYKVMMTSQIVDDPTQSDFYKPFQEFPTSISQDERQRLRKEGWVAIQEAVVPAYQDFLDFMEEEYMPGARESIAITDLPGGEKYYNFLVQYYTTLDLSPREIHQIGLEEVKRIRSEMEAIIKDVEFEGTFDEFLQFLRTDPQFYVEEPEQLLKEATYIAKRMDGQLPRLFNMMPRKPYGVEPVPAHLAPRYTGGRYSPADGETDAGNYWVNTYDLDSRPLYTLEALTFHEAVPGHHLQIALAKELDLPEIRREAGVTAFVEGWALYSERLGLEAGFYQDPYSNFGRLTYEMWRACRLVVDTGMHALGWSRERAVQFMTENTALSHHEINTEINRYIAVPGQALAYKIGELKIRELREKAEQELGDNFDVRKFHDAVLLNGPVPLTALEQNIEDYIEKTKTEAEKEDET
ncbi:DUF885 domain-containing protein [Aliifodinibius sp. S!AR15-10]|uniref:DUF885 domain-containing protein n=1 Tax=Aliifodinibius sp. S!AR15-10 TaxID=2950437 RepID=UPI002864B1CC|nr:DUF885 domain-containing protein [Aliifodinibius sp. S!AR15-10]MDR8390636.1 DUF885 domain-containing protein [Aliifodinibius sp. S!AR15-10]